MKKIIILTLFIIIYSCQFNQKFENREADKNEAEIVCAELFEFMKNKDFQNASKLFDDEFYKVTSKKDLITFFENMHNNFGTLQSTDLIKWNTLVSEGSTNTGTYALIYKSNFENNSVSQKISLKKTKDNLISIIGYKIIE